MICKRYLYSFFYFLFKKKRNKYMTADFVNKINYTIRAFYVSVYLHLKQKIKISHVYTPQCVD